MMSRGRRTKRVVVMCDGIFSYFQEMCVALIESLQEMGFEATLAGDPYEQDNVTADVVFLVAPRPVTVRTPNFKQCAPKAKWIWIQTEQLLGNDQHNNFWMRRMHFVHTYFDHVVDFSEPQVEWLRGQGANASTLRIGYHPSFEKCRGETLWRGEGADVLFIGTMNPRRKAVLDDLEGRGIRVTTMADDFTDERIRAARTARINLNIHQGATDYWESLRNEALLISNGAFLISESSRYAAPLESGIHYIAADYANLADTCQNWLGEAEERATISRQGYQFLKEKLPFKTSLLKFLAETKITP